MLKTLNSKPIDTQTAKIIIEDHDKLPKFPIDQKVNFCNCSAELKYARTPTIALVKLPNIKPTIRIAIVSRNRCDTAKTVSNTIELPMVDAKTTPYDDNKTVLKKGGSKLAPNITKATPKLEPELSPKTYGPASGFRNSVCINKPLMDSPIPTRIAVIALGSL